MNKKKRTGNANSGNFVYIPVAVLMALFVGVFGVSVFFKVTNIEVVGVVRYSAEQVIAVTGIHVGDNLIFIDRGEAAKRICAELPYVREVLRIERAYPDTVRIILTESAPVACVMSNGAWWNVDSYGRLLGEATGKPQDLIEIRGITPEEPVAGEKIKVADSATTRLSYMADVLKAFEAAEVQNSVSRLDVSNVGSITFRYDEKFTVNLGNADDVQYKLQKLQEVIQELRAGDTGVIDLSISGQRSFIPD